MADEKGTTTTGSAVPTVPPGAAGPTKREKRERAKEAALTEGKLDDFIAAVHRMATAVSDSDIFAKHGVTVAEWSMLKAMGDKSEAAMKEVGRRAGVSRQRLRTLLADLEKKGFIKVARDDAGGDRRARSITIAPKTAEVVAAIAGEFNKMAESSPQMGKLPGKKMTSAVRMTAKLGMVIARSSGEDGDDEGGGKAAGGKPGANAEKRKAAREERAAARAKQ